MEVLFTSEFLISNVIIVIMKKIYIILLLFVVLFFINQTTIYSQKYELKKITLYIVPINNNVGFDIPYNRIKEYSSIKITIKDWFELAFFSKMLYGLKCETIAEINKDFRILCIIHWGYKKEKIYFNKYGHFLYNGKACRNENIWEFILSNIPDKYK
ncbi:MAG: hypothetical protein PWQ14_425 [Rikenellaceae bacterium]|nr:hypothetical protein [Rikenellaceae bacterium]